MPRNPDNRNEFIAGKLPIVKFENDKFFVDGRMRELRNINDFSHKITEEDFLSIKNKFKRKDLGIIQYEFEGVNHYL